MTDGIDISQLGTAQAIANTDLFPLSQTVSGSYYTNAAAMSQVATYVAGSLTNLTVKGTTSNSSPGAPIFGVFNSTEAGAAFAVLDNNVVDTQYNTLDDGGGNMALHGSLTTADVANIITFGADRTGTNDSTTAIQNAVNTGKPVFIPPGTYMVSNGITCSTVGQKIFGAGRTASTISVPSSFLMSAAGVFVITSGEPGPIFEDFCVKFVQPDTATRADLTSYPAAFYCSSSPRTQWRHIGIYAGQIGVSLVNNCGGSYIDDLQGSCFYVNIQQSGTGSLDSVRISRAHVWNFFLTTNQASIFTSTGTYGIVIQAGSAIDDLHVTDCLFLVGSQWLLVSGTDSWGEVVNCSFDSYASVFIEGGFWSIVGGYFSQGASYALNVLGGTVNVDSVYFQFGSPATVNPCIVINPSTSGGSLGTTDGVADVKFTNCTFWQSSLNNTMIYALPSADCAVKLSITNCHFTTASNATYTYAIVNMPAPPSGGSSRMTAIGNTIVDKGSGSGTWFSIGQDDWHRVVYNAPIGWSNTFPTGSSLNGIYSPN
jgi:hypothetical protein